MDTAITTFEAPTVPEIHGDMGIVVSAIPKSSYTNQVLEFTVDISSIPLEDSVFVSCTDAEGENFTGRWVDVGERTYRVSFCPNRKGTATINLHYNNVRLDFSASVEIIADEERSDTRDPSALQYSRCCPLCLDEYPRRRAAYVNCGHIVCLPCAYRSLAVCASCSYCRRESDFVRLFEDAT